MRISDIRGLCGEQKGIEIAPQRVDLGEKVFSPEEVQFTIQVRNRGSAKVNVKARPSCGCVKATRVPTLEPGEAGRIEVGFDTAGRVGKQDESLHIYRDEETSPAITVAITGTVKADYTWQPKTISFGRFSWTGDKMRSLTITPMEMHNVHIPGVKFTQPSRQPAKRQTCLCPPARAGKQVPGIQFG